GACGCGLWFVGFSPANLDAGGIWKYHLQHPPIHLLPPGLVFPALSFPSFGHRDAPARDRPSLLSMIPPPLSPRSRNRTRVPFSARSPRQAQTLLPSASSPAILIAMRFLAVLLLTLASAMAAPQYRGELIFPL